MAAGSEGMLYGLSAFVSSRSWVRSPPALDSLVLTLRVCDSTPFPLFLARREATPRAVNTPHPVLCVCVHKM
jgi:hypothetical protein